MIDADFRIIRRRWSYLPTWAPKVHSKVPHSRRGGRMFSAQAAQPACKRHRPAKESEVIVWVLFQRPPEEVNEFNLADCQLQHSEPPVQHPRNYLLANASAKTTRRSPNKHLFDQPPADDLFRRLRSIGSESEPLPISQLASA